MILFLTEEEILEIHKSRIDLYGGSHGVRDIGLLLSALEMPKQSFEGAFLHGFPYEMAAAYLFHLSKNHPFVDGNKRTALAVMLIFLEINDFELMATNDDLEDLVLDVATSKKDKKAITVFLEQYSREKK